MGRNAKPRPVGRVLGRFPIVKISYVFRRNRSRSYAKMVLIKFGSGRIFD